MQKRIIIIIKKLVLQDWICLQLGIDCVSNRDVTVTDKGTRMCWMMLDQTPENLPHCHIIPRRYNRITCTCNNSVYTYVATSNGRGCDIENYIIRYDIGTEKRLGLRQSMIINHYAAVSIIISYRYLRAIYI